MKRISKQGSVADDMKTARIWVNNPVVAGRDDWKKDNQIDAYKTSNLDAKFACDCGTSFSPAGMTRCACGRTWNSFVISPNEKIAGKATLIVRPVNEYRERVLATKKTSGWVRHAVEQGMPSFVRAATDSGQDVAPTTLDGSTQDRGIQSPMTPGSVDGDDSGSDPMAQQNTLTGRKNAAGGWQDPANANPATTKPAGAYKPPASVAPPKAAQPAPAAQTAAPKQWGPPAVVPTAQPAAVQPAMTAPVAAPAVAPAVQPQMQQVAPQTIGQPGVNPLQQPARTYKMAFSEDDYRMGWVLAENDSPLPARQLHASFIEGYSDCLRSVLGDKAPGWDTVAPDFEAPDADKNNSMSDNTDTTKGEPLPDYREQLADKLDKDNKDGQSRSGDSMTDLTGWKSSALINELARRSALKKA